MVDVKMHVKAQDPNFELYTGYDVQVEVKPGDRDSRLIVDDGKYDSDPNTVENSDDDEDESD